MGARLFSSLHKIRIPTERTGRGHLPEKGRNHPSPLQRSCRGQITLLLLRPPGLRHPRCGASSLQRFRSGPDIRLAPLPRIKKSPQHSQKEESQAGGADAGCGPGESSQQNKKGRRPSGQRPSRPLERSSEAVTSQRARSQQEPSEPRRCCRLRGRPARQELHLPFCRCLWQERPEASRHV